MSDLGFLARRGVLELAMSIEACMLSWLEGGCLSTQSTPPGSAPVMSIEEVIELLWASVRFFIQSIIGSNGDTCEVLNH